MTNRITSYNPLPITFTHGQGAWLYDEKGRDYLDGLSGIAVCGLGHAHPEVTKTITEQAQKCIHVSNLFHIKEQQMLAEKLHTLTGMEQMFFTNSGAEANETAIKLTRLYGHHLGIETPSVIVMEKAFHGRTMATLTASGTRKLQAGFEPLVPGFIRAPFNDFEAIETIAANRRDVVAIMLEPIQGEGGIHVADDTYMKKIQAFCQEKGWLFILDEVQTGNDRTGEWFAFMHAHLQPDIVTTAKGLGNGMPIGACMMNHKACDLLKPGNHGSTFGGNPLACATALTVLSIIERDKLCAKAAKDGFYLREHLSKALHHVSGVRAIRGKGLMIGIELDRPAIDARMIGLQNGILFNVTAENVIRLLPPFIMNQQELDELIKRLSQTIQTFLNH